MARQHQLVLDADPRAVAGVITGTSAMRDWEIVRWVGRLGAVTIGQLRVPFDLGRTAVYRRVAALIRADLLERVATLPGQPTLIRATRRGLRYVGLGLSVAPVPPQLVGHWMACGWVALELEREFGHGAVSSDREIAMAERFNSGVIASAKLGEHPDGTARLHRPDLAVSSDDRVIAVEVELTPKAPRRLEAIVRAWRRARWIESVRYYAAEGPTTAGLRRAIRKSYTTDRIEVRSVDPLLGG